MKPTLILKSLTTNLIPFRGKRLAASAKAAGISRIYNNRVGTRQSQWGSSAIYNGLLLYPADHATLTAYFEKKKAEKSHRTNNPDRATRLQKQKEKMERFVRANWTLDEQDIHSFMTYVTDPESGHPAVTAVLGMEAKLNEALLTWVRRTKTDYHQALKGILLGLRNTLSPLEQSRLDNGRGPIPSLHKRTANTRKLLIQFLCLELVAAKRIIAQQWLDERRIASTSIPAV